MRMFTDDGRVWKWIGDDDDLSLSPESIRRRLLSIGIDLDDDGHGNPSERVGPDDLRERVGDQQVIAPE